MSKHNPAPWTYENRQDRLDLSAYGVVLDADGKVLFDTLNSDVAEIHTERDEESVIRTDERGRVNLTLAAAAPYLLAACEMVLDDPGLTASANDVIRAAIAKARGA